MAALVQLNQVHDRRKGNSYAQVGPQHRIIAGTAPSPLPLHYGHRVRAVTSK
ncbi:hypothetical protein ONA92_09345 [Mycobacteroides salmoniphilum]